MNANQPPDVAAKKHVGEYLPLCKSCRLHWHASLLIDGLCPACRRKP
jgi:hypothetical protein